MAETEVPTVEISEPAPPPPEPTITVEPPDTTPPTIHVTQLEEEAGPTLTNVSMKTTHHDDEDFEVASKFQKHKYMEDDDDEMFSTPRKSYGDRSYDDYSYEDYTSRLIETTLGDYRATEAKLMNHPLVQKNRPDPLINPKIRSRRSREIIREGYDLGFSSPGLRALYDVNILHYLTCFLSHALVAIGYHCCSLIVANGNMVL